MSQGQKQVPSYPPGTTVHLEHAAEQEQFALLRYQHLSGEHIEQETGYRELQLHNLIREPATVQKDVRALFGGNSFGQERVYSMQGSVERCNHSHALQAV